MALRAFVRAAPTWLRPPLARRLAAAADLEEVDAAAPAPDPLKHAPSVFDKMVQLIVIDVEGKRNTLRGLVGQRLIDVLADNMNELGGDQVVGLSPEGRGELEAHVSVPNEWLKQLPPLTDEDKRSLEEIAPYVGRNSRLASKVTLTHALNGFVIALGELRPWKTL